MSVLKFSVSTLNVRTPFSWFFRMSKGKLYTDKNMSYLENVTLKKFRCCMRERVGGDECGQDKREEWETGRRKEEEREDK